MDSPLSKVILAILGGYFIILLSISAYDWISKEYPKRPSPPPNPVDIHHPVDHKEAVNALKRFSQLPKSERTAIRKNLETNLISLERWFEHLSRVDYQIICIGEHHENATRDFLAEEFFPKFKADTLLLEATPEMLKHLIRRMEAGRDYFPLLDADIMGILRTVKDKNPGIKIYGIEETDKQAERHHGYMNARDQSIAQNFWATFEPGLRHIILFGALHCSNESNWLFHNLFSQASPILKNEMLNVNVMGQHQNGPMEGFVFFMDQIGIQKRHFVIPDTNLFHPRIYELFQTLKQQTLDKYQAVLVYRS